MHKLNARTAYLFMSGVSAFSMMLIFTGLTAYYVRTIGMSPLQLVMVGTAVELTCFLFEVTTGIVADVYSQVQLHHCIRATRRCGRLIVT